MRWAWSAGAATLAALVLPAALAPAAHAGGPSPPAAAGAPRAVCGRPVTGSARCAAVELTAERPQAAQPGAASSTPPCQPPIPAEGCKGLRPADLHTAYGLPATAPATTTVAIVDAWDDPRLAHDLGVFDEEFGLPPCTVADHCLTKVNQLGQRKPLPAANGEWAVEIALDVETVHSVCQNCRVLLVEAQSAEPADLEAAENRAVTLGAQEITNSWYFEEEPALDSSAFDHPGIVVTAAAGDEGFRNWELVEEVGGTKKRRSGEGPPPGPVNYPASSPHVVAVGGTRLALEPTTGAWAGESVWNGAGVGGSACSEHFAAPGWQSQLGDWPEVGCAEDRAVADVAAIADPHVGFAVYDSEPEQPGLTPYWVRVGGTSLSSPLIAAAYALAGGAGGVDYPARTLYENAEREPLSLHDVQSGSNGECTNRPTEEQLLEGLSACSVAEEGASCSEQRICVAGPGYDGPSGVGTPDGLGAFAPVSEASKTQQAITFASTAPAAARVGAGVYVLSASASSGLPVHLTSGAPSVCAVAGALVTFVEPGHCTLNADQAGDATFAQAAQAHQSFTVGLGEQTIAFASSPPPAAHLGDGPYVLAATATSGLAVTLASETPAVCTISGATVSYDAVGTCTVLATQAGSSDWEPAPPARQSFGVAGRVQTITFSSTAPAGAIVEGASYVVAAAASSGLPVSFTSRTPAVCALTGTTVSFAAAGTCTLAADQAGDGEWEAASEALQSFTVDAAAVAAVPEPKPEPEAEPEPEELAETLPYQLSLAPASAVTLSLPSVRARAGAILIRSQSTGAGVLRWRLTFGAITHSTRACSTRLHTCTRRVLFGAGAITLAGTATTPLTVRPGASAIAAMRGSSKRADGVPVTVTLVLRASSGSSEVQRAVVVLFKPAGGSGASGARPNGAPHK
ncbi:MAG TPA: hypothetical protein VHT27_09040 [Solirubrobacteraceae bacterium]|nr:hypothetical protein [Solirubrobacteraceae bacterium]